MRKKKGIFGTLCMALGLLLLLGAAGLTYSNIRDERMAGEASEEVLAALLAEGTEETREPGEIPDYILDPYMKMPETVIDGNAYIGKVEVPKLGLTLPVMSEWSYPKLKKAPCRYMGSAYTGDLIIAGHNYRKHFNGLKTLSVGDEILFTDEAGNEFRYVVSEIERLGGYEVEAMEAGEWDLTLFTCTQGGSVRLTVRCELSEDMPLLQSAPGN